MTSIALGLFIIFILYVMVWSIRNDKARSILDQTGLIRMRAPSGKPRKSNGRSGLRRRQTAASPPSDRAKRHR